jgi:hypothetical protein
MSSIKKVNCPRCNKEVYAEEQDEMLLEQAKGMLRSCMEDGR